MDSGVFLISILLKFDEIISFIRDLGGNSMENECVGKFNQKELGGGIQLILKGGCSH